MCLTCSALSWRGLCARLKRVLSTNRDNSAVRSKHVFCVCADYLYRSSQDGESDSSSFISFFSFFLYFCSSFFFFYILFNFLFFNFLFITLSSIIYRLHIIQLILFFFLVQCSPINLNLSSNFVNICVVLFPIFY